MLRSIKQLYGDKLGATDGEIGYVKDFYFDDRIWVVRYMVVHAGTWLTGRLVLLSPHALSDFYRDGACRAVNLTRQQIENSPPIESHKPVSRQFETEYYDYYQWAPYWYGGAMWGMGGYPMPLTMALPPRPPSNHGSSAAVEGDPHLRSMQELRGYTIHASNGEIGKVSDFIVHEKSWAVVHLVVETGSWYAGKEIALAPKHISHISYNESKVFVNVTSEDIHDAPEYQTPPWAYEDAENIAV